jgi:hypothetical protein
MATFKKVVKKETVRKERASKGGSPSRYFLGDLSEKQALAKGELVYKTWVEFHQKKMLDEVAKV